MGTRERIVATFVVAALLAGAGPSLRAQVPAPLPEAPAGLSGGGLDLGAPGAAARPAAGPAKAPQAHTGGSDKKKGRGLRGVLRLFAGQSASTEATRPGPVEKRDEAEKETDEETRRVHELARLSVTNIEKGRVAEATRNLNDLIALKPYEASYHFALGLCYRREGKYREALKKYQDVMDLGGPKALVAVLRAEAYASEGDREKVIDYLREAAVGGRNIIQDVGSLAALTPYQQDTEFIKQALQLEQFDVRGSKKHDPFTNPFPKFDRRAVEESDGGDGVVALTPEDQEKMLLDARKTYEKVKFFIKLEDEVKAMKAYGELREMIQKKDLLTIPKIAGDFRVVVGQLEHLEIEIEGIRLKYYYNHAQVMLKKMKEAFVDREFQKVGKLHADVTKLTQEMQQVNKNYKAVADQILALSTRWYRRAEVRKEFEARKPRIEGIVITDAGKLALLNNRLVRQGEALDDFRVVKVESNKVTFRYKGEDIPLLFRRY